MWHIFHVIYNHSTLDSTHKIDGNAVVALRERDAGVDRLPQFLAHHVDAPAHSWLSHVHLTRFSIIYFLLHNIVVMT